MSHTLAVRRGDAARAMAAETSAGRTGGYCWMEPEGGGSHCTLKPGHKGQHFDFYSRREFD